MSCPELIESKYQQHVDGLGEKINCNQHPASRGWFLVCEHGVVVLAPGATEAFEVHGAIFTKFQDLGFDRLGFPLSDELPTTDGWGRYSKFEKGYIYWSPLTGSHEIKGEIYRKWKSLGGEQGFLGYPTTDQKQSGLRDNETALYNDFQHASIYNHPQHSRGAHEIHGDIREFWISKGREQSVFGFPVSDELTPIFNNDARFSIFDHFSLYWHPNVGVQESRGSLDDNNFFANYISTDNTEENPGDAGKMLQFVKDKNNPLSHFRRKVATLALQEVVDGHSGEDAADRYGAETFWVNEYWCSEFVRWVFKNSMDMSQNSAFRTAILVMTKVSNCRKFFQRVRYHLSIDDKLWYYARDIGPNTAQVGDYISVNNGDHSALIVAITFDKQWIHTAEGNVGDRTHFGLHQYFHKNDGYQLNREIYGIGKIHRKMFSDILSKEYY